MNNERKVITIAHLTDILAFPPVINLIENLLKNGNSVNLVSYNVKGLREDILNHEKFSYIELDNVVGKSLTQRIKRRFLKNRQSREAVKKYMENSDILWTTTDVTVRSLGKLIFKYKHIMQIMDLINDLPLYGGAKYLKFPIHKYAQRAWKLVVPEVNRAYIQKTWWEVENTPYVLPNKPYTIDPGQVPDNMKEILDKMEKEKRKIVLYLGVLASDRNLENFAKAIESLNGEYALYIVGDILDSYKAEMKQIMDTYSCVEYLGYFPAPKHLLVVNKSYIGLLPYRPNKRAYSDLNALYCAPNKIYEYSAYGVPMLGSDVIGLKYPFELYKMGVCCDEKSVDEIIKGIRTIEKDYENMSKNCKAFFDDIDLDKIVEDIIYEEV